MKNKEQLLEQLHNSSEIPLHVFARDGELVFKRISSDDLSDPFIVEESLAKICCAKISEQENPVLLVADEGIIYGGFALDDEAIFIYGPVRDRIEKISSSLIIAAMTLLGKEQPEPEVVDVEHIHEDLHEQLKKELLDYRLINSEIEKARFNYEHEEKWIKQIESGNLEPAREFNYSMSLKVGKMANQKIKQAEYAFVCAVTLATRAAIRGGFRVFEAYELSDIYLQRLERCTSVLAILRLTQSMIMDFTMKVRMVKDKSAESDYVVKCKDYIAQCINQKISVAEMAKKLGFNRSYLSHRFKEEQGISIQEYIIKERVRMAENMLRYSEESISRIAEYLGFSSQSHLGVYFRKYTNFTPMEYRKQYQVRDFITVKEEN